MTLYYVTLMIVIDTVCMCRIEDEIQLGGQLNFEENKVVKIFPVAAGR